MMGGEKRHKVNTERQEMQIGQELTEGVPYAMQEPCGCNSD